TLFTVQKALPLMKDGASIIMNGSVANLKGIPNFSVYNASKAALRSFARTWTNDLKDRKIRVNLLSPGPIDTAIMDNIPDELIKGFISQVPLGRIGKSEEIATAALFLASADSAYVTGIDLCVDGGMAQV
ncbi:SDR family oxidoreductase, partial [Cutibacterium acnes]